ncbi:DUF2306 domain-containing protein [Glycomyces sp. TRM65418]|uniref:DUF2306 domain-containing protein n=1 Tax=Glycomyces sp. TRM65418 TaxID=2867006 RepID=UPI001CE56650|nr:DUF2306 domain-containing protein [Glycomyces sp. TRM65418]MCC3762940.1 DUF2306 domain-containing protein [Glycomyces sp. TRM65418]QZD56964.1 DUF2306 domain-containing protein [Glycomyces sp. TRM65418]
MSATLAAPGRIPSRRRRVAVTVVAVLSVGVTLYAVPVYLFGSHMRIELREDVPIHLPVLVVHAATAGIALLVGPFQFFGSIRRRSPRTHRLLGRVYLLAGVLPGSLTGIVVAVLTTAGPLAVAAFVFIDVYWFYTALRAYRAVRSRDFAGHERWMLRNMAATFAAVTLRVFIGLFVVAQLPLLQSVYGGDFQALFDRAYLAAIVGSVVVNVLFIEIYLRRRDNRRIRAGADAPAGLRLGA